MSNRHLTPGAVIHWRDGWTGCITTGTVIKRHLDEYDKVTYWVCERSTNYVLGIDSVAIIDDREAEAWALACSF